MLAVAVYSLCAAATLGCSGLLVRAYRRARTPLLFWSAICFAFLTVNNTLVAIDLVVFPGIDLFLLRNLAALAGIGRFSTDSSGEGADYGRQGESGPAGGHRHGLGGRRTLLSPVLAG